MKVNDLYLDRAVNMKRSYIRVDAVELGQIVIMSAVSMKLSNYQIIPSGPRLLSNMQFSAWLVTSLETLKSRP